MMSESGTAEQCMCCGHSEQKFLYEKLGIPISKCEACGLGKALADGFNAKEYYDASYFSGERDDGYADYLGTEKVLKHHFQQELDLLARLGSKTGTLLEIGCAYGYFLELAQQHFEVHGLEICEEAAANCREKGLVNVGHGAASKESLSSIPALDVAVMLDVIEHLSDPKDTLQEIAAKLQPGGRLLLTTGNFASFCARVMGKHWRLMTPPAHLWFFTPDSIEKMANSVGLELEYFDHPSKKVPFGLIVFQLCHYLSFHPRLPAWMHKVGIRLNLFDAMRVVLKKPS